MRTFARVVPGLLVGGLLVGCLGIGMQPAGRDRGKPAPPVEGVDADGRSFRLDEYRGKVVLLSFWHQY